MNYDIVTIFPELFEGFLKESILGKAQKRGNISINIHRLRDWAEDKHKTLDDTPYGGGPGMVLKVEPIYKAVQDLKEVNKTKKVGRNRTRVIHFSPRGKMFTTKDARRYAKYYDQLILICGRYEGVDERVAEQLADETLSIGDFILIGGEVASMAVVEAVSRFIPGVIGRKDSVMKSDYPQYTKPEVFNPTGEKKWKIPEVLVSGNHKKIAAWRKENGKELD